MLSDQADALLLLAVPELFVALVESLLFNCLRPDSPATAGDMRGKSSLDPPWANFDRVLKWLVEEFLRESNSGEVRFGA